MPRREWEAEREQGRGFPSRNFNPVADFDLGSLGLRYRTAHLRVPLAVAFCSTLVVAALLCWPVPKPAPSLQRKTFPAWTQYHLPIDSNFSGGGGSHFVRDSSVSGRTTAAQLIQQEKTAVPADSETAKSDEPAPPAAPAIEDVLPERISPIESFSSPAPAPMALVTIDTIPGIPQSKPPGTDTSQAGRARPLTAADSLRALGVRDTTRKDTSAGKHWLYNDTTYVVDMDSTSRLRQWVRPWRDHGAVELFPDKVYPLYLQPRVPSYRRDITLDSTGSFVSFHEREQGLDMKVPLNIPLKEYIAKRKSYEIRKMFADDARKPKALAARNDLGELMSNITQINIPIPANPIFSIFGKQEIRLNISGAVDVKAGFRNIKNDQTTISVLDQVRNEPDFSQEVQVNVNGTIGDKLNILADWNTKRTFEYENQLKIKYTGYEDEIVQSVEAGNVSLSTPSAFIGSSAALFGIKAKFQFGPLTLTTLASQKKGQIKSFNVSGGASEKTFEFHGYEYATNHFFVDTLYADSAHYDAYYQQDPPVVRLQDKIIEAEVWVTRQGGIPDPNERQGIAYISLNAKPLPAGYDTTKRTATTIPGQIENGVFVRLDPSQYELDGDGYLGEVSLNTNVSDAQIVAVAYRTATSQWGDLTRDMGADKTTPLVLKMVKPQNLIATGPVYSTAWKLLLKNIYPIPGVDRNLKRSGFSLDIFRVVPGQSDQNSILNEPLLRVFGLDRYSGADNDNPTPDGTFDFRPGRTISQTRAEIIFPTLRPFDAGVKNYFAQKGLTLPDSTYYYPLVYDTTETFSQQSDRNRYVIRGKATGESTSKFELGFNIVEGSVRVILNGAALTPNVDYTVDYIVGEVVIKNPAALVPGANLQISYEQNDLFQLASKTLLGARGDLNLGPQTQLGFTIMNLNQQTLSDKVRLGEEPNVNTIMGIDGSTAFDLPFLTRALDALPLIQTKEASNLKVSGEVAYMIPDPNTKKSTIPGDGGVGVAYVDDFEGARRSLPVGIIYNAWTISSPPEDSASNAEFGAEDTAKMNSKAKMVWFNRLPTNVALTDIYPRKVPGNAANNQATVLDLEYFPAKRGSYNYSMDLENTLTPRRNWSGIMKPISVSAINFSKENINYIELWLKIDKMPADGTAKMLVDLGAISERAVPNGRNGRTANTPNSEALVLTSTPTVSVLNGTDRVNGADRGVDMYNDIEEQQLYAPLIAKYRKAEPDLVGDPSGDDWYFDNSTVNTPREDFSHINGTEGNFLGPGGRNPDTEDLNGNGIVDLANSYFEYEFSLDTTSSNPSVVGAAIRDDGTRTGWVQYRIPVQDWARAVGTPTLENVEFVRVLFKDISDTTFVRVGDFSLVGNQWQKIQSQLNDSSYGVAVVSIEDNPDYSSPPGVIREQDHTQPDQRILANEQSLDFQARGIPDGQSREAVKYFTYKALDLINYRTMKMYVHTDPRFLYRDPTNYDAAVFFRFGLDSLNYYEYRVPLRPDPSNGNWSEIVINFSDLTAIKQARDSTTALVTKPVPGGPLGSTYGVLGNPSLTQIIFLGVGVENPPGTGTVAPLVGDVWFDELRLISPDDTKGVAYRFDTQLKLADIGAVSFNYSRVDPFFHSLEDRFGTRQLSTNWALSTSFNFEKLFPENWAGTTIPFSYAHTDASVSPRYLANSDILVNQAANELYNKRIEDGASAQQAQASSDSIITTSQTHRTSDTYALPNIHIAWPSQAWYIRDTFNKLNFGFTYTKSIERSPAVVLTTAWSWNARIAYALTFPTDSYILPFKRIFDGYWFLDDIKALKIYYAPTSFSWSLNTARSRSTSLQRAPGATDIVSRNFTASRGFAFSWKFTEGGFINPSLDYNMSVESSLLDFELDQNNQQRTFSQILKHIFFSDHLINFGQDTRYSQHNQFNTKPVIPNIFGIKRYLDLTFSYGVDYSWSNQLIKSDYGKSAQFSNSISTSMNLKLKQLFDPLFAETPAAGVGQQPAPRGRRGETAVAVPDTTTRADTSGVKLTGMKKTLNQLLTLLKVFIKTPILDYDNVNITFTQTNNSQANGVIGGTGFMNFWGRAPFIQSSLPENGPSRLFQLGLISDPSGELTHFGVRHGFPFFGWDVEPGPRAAGGILSNQFRQTNRLSFKTSRGLWEGAHLDLNWNVGWSYSRAQSLEADTLNHNIPIPLTSQTSGSVDRSFLTFPDVLFLGIFKTSLKEVSKRYADLKNNGDASTNDDQKLTQAFEEGFEAFPILRKIFGQFTPRVNWSLRWDGLEKLPMFAGFVSRLSLDHSYNSNFTRQFEVVPGLSGERTDAQRVMYGFAPLVGLNFTFKELAKGQFGANFKYSTNTSYDLALSSRNIVETLAQEISLTGSYSRKGFEFPLFGLSLQNDIDLSFSYSVTVNSRKTYDTSQLDVNVTPTPLEGSTRTVMEPRIKYVLSSRVTASIYYRFTKVAPDDAGSRIPGSTTNEAGLDIHIAIQ